MAYLNKLDYTSRRAPELVAYRKLGCEYDLPSTLLCAYLYNLVIHSKKNDQQDFNKCYGVLLQIPNHQFDPKGILLHIVNTCSKQDATPKAALEWCLYYIDYYCSGQNEREFFNIMNRFSAEKEFNTFCRLFSNYFQISITCLMPDKISEFVPDIPGRYINLKIIENSGFYYIPFSKHMIEAEKQLDSRYLEQNFNSEPYIKHTRNPLSPRAGQSSGMVPVAQEQDLDEYFKSKLKDYDKSTKLTIRFPISYLPVDDAAKPEFEVEYASFVKVSENRNQLRAFAFQLSSILKAFPGDSYLKLIQDKLKLKQCMCDMILEEPEHFGDKSVETILNICENLVKTAAKYQSFAQDIPGLRLEVDIESEFKTIQALCKIFGVASVVIFKENNYYKRIKFNGTVNNFTPTFHFFSETNHNMKKVYALVTKRMNFIENFDYKNQVSKPVESFIRDEPSRENIDKSGNDDNLMDIQLEFYKTLIIIQDKIISSYKISIENNLPVYIQDNITENINQLKILKHHLERHPGNNIKFDDIVLINSGIDKLSTACGICNCLPRENEKTFYNTNGVFFHFNCVQNVYIKWQSNQNFNEDIENYEIEFTDRRKNILVISFLKADSQCFFLDVFKLYVNKGVLCCSCNKLVAPIDQNLVQSYSNGEAKKEHCLICYVKIFQYDSCFKCKNTAKNMNINPETKIYCPRCDISTILSNFWYNQDINMAMCKKCWSQEAKNHKEQGQQFDHLLNFGNDPMVLNSCELCGQTNVIRYIGEKFHCNGSIFCIDCGKDNDLCPECGMKFNQNLDNLWI